MKSIRLKFTEECAVRFSKNAFAELSKSSFSQGALIVTDETVYRLYGKKMAKYLPAVPVVAIPAGEENKTADTLFAVLRALADHKLHRNSVLITVGGGVVCDLGGLAAALYMRGIECVQVPTTLLAQVDAGVGGKNAVNFLGVKNLLGTIRQPSRILIDTSFLKTLPEREIKCGLGEIVKHAALDGDLFDRLIANRDKLFDLQFLSGVVSQNVAVKLDLVKQDPHDRTGVRWRLNLGHTTAHSIELSGSLSHGECVAWGILCEAELAKRHFACDTAYLDSLQSLCRVVLESVKPHFSADSVEMDKKNSSDKVVCIVPVRKGECERLALDPEQYFKEIEDIEKALC